MLARLAEELDEPVTPGIGCELVKLELELAAAVDDDAHRAGPQAEEDGRFPRKCPASEPKRRMMVAERVAAMML